MSNFKPIETQEELDRIISERLARQKEKYADYDQVKARVSELEKENGV
ncbi:TPA: phage scaffold protein, partial [Streptococcus suis]|nr:phage scaffold protein [Streptococcus suis]